MPPDDACPDQVRDQLGPKENTDDATMADMGLTGTPARSATPAGQGDEAGVGAEEDEVADTEQSS